MQTAGELAVAAVMTDDTENAGDETGGQDGEARPDLSPDGERRPRRRGRRGGRRRRGGAEDGLVGSISDELGPTSAPEVVEAVADFDSVSSAPEQQTSTHEAEPQPKHQAPQPEMTSPPTQARDEVVAESEKAARRRSTVREKVSFVSEEAPPVVPVVHSEPEPSTPEPQQPTPDASNEAQPRRAGWWSRRFGNGT